MLISCMYFEYIKIDVFYHIYCVGNFFYCQENIMQSPSSIYVKDTFFVICRKDSGYV